MRRLLALAAYTCMALGASAADADPAIAALREGDMKKLVLHAEPRPVPAEAFTAPDGGPGPLAEYRGSIIVLNFWATWCAPCRKEMPTLSRLQEALGGADLQVVALSLNPRRPEAERAFLEQIGVANLPAPRDEGLRISRAMGVRGLPVTVIIDRGAMEIARLVGEADWSSQSAQAILRALIDAP